MKKEKILIAILALVIVVGTVITMTIGLNFDLRYQETKKIELYLEKKFEIKDIKNIASEVLNGQKTMIQKIEVYEDAVSIIAKEITPEQKNEIIKKINEKYGIELVADDVAIINIPNTRGRDIIKPYIVPFIVALGIILVYMAIRYHKLNAWRVVAKTFIVSVVAQALLLSIMAITRIPVGRLTIPMAIVVYLLTLYGITNKFEKELENKKLEKENK